MYPAKIAEHNLASNALLTRRRQLRVDCKLKMKTRTMSETEDRCRSKRELMRLRHLNWVNID